MAAFFVILSREGLAKKFEPVSAEERRNYIRAAQVWQPTDIPHMDIWRGPRNPHAYEFEQSVSCTYVPKKMGGTTSKFKCRTEDSTSLKVRYDSANGKVYAMPAATRLFWALGFGAARSYPARVFCHNCPEDPFATPFGMDIADREFHPAVIDFDLPGAAITTNLNEKPGWDWKELELVDPEHGGAPRAHVDALKLLAAFVQHGDNNPGQQKLMCLPGGIVQDGQGKTICTEPFMMVEDLGSTFGGSEMLDERASMNLEAWAAHPIWKDKDQCIADLAQTPEGSLSNPKISEQGRAFLAHLLMQLTDHQIEDIFRIGRADQRNQNEQGLRALEQKTASISDWVRVFKTKRDQIAQTRCAH
jgi:hypothetical protein